MWDWVTVRVREHPTGTKWLITCAFVGIVTYVLLASVTSVLISQGRDTCEQNNGGRLAGLREASALEANAEAKEAIARERGDEAMAERWAKEAKTFAKKQRDLIGVAKASGHQATEGAVTIACAGDWPKPLPWFEAVDP